MDNKHYIKLLTKDFFEKYYINKKMSYPKIRQMLLKEGYNIHIGTLHKYAKKFNIGRNATEARQNWDKRMLDYNKKYINKNDIEFIDGFLLGDGGANSSKKSARLQCSVEYKEFCEYLMYPFSHLKVKVKKINFKSMNQGFVFNGRTCFHPDIYQQYLRWYPKNKNGKRYKQPPNDVKITPESVMRWYLGDGTLSQSEDRSTVTVRLSTDSFDKERIDMLVNKLKEKNINCNRTRNNRIRIKTKAIGNFFDFIGHKSPVKCYNYKFDLPEWRLKSKRMKDVCDDLNINYNRLSHLVKNNEVPCFRLSKKGRPRFLPEHIEKIKEMIKNNSLYKYKNKKVDNKKKESIILRVSKEEHDIIKMKSFLFNKKKSDFIRDISFKYWEVDNKYFDKIFKLYKESNEENKQIIINLLFEYYRRKGFPYIELNDKEKIKQMERVVNSKNILLDNNYLQFNTQGISLANYYHSHMMEAYYNNKNNSPIETFNNDDKLKDCIKRWMDIGKKPNHAGIRQILKTRNGTRAVGNFKPVIAKYIYDNYVERGGAVLDPCAGYGGRLAGCIASNKNLMYHGIDPNGDTAIGNTKMASFFKDLNNDGIFNKERMFDFRFKFDMGCAEYVMHNLNNKYDLIFTSPPYYNLEIYENNNNQSSEKYKTYDEWKNKFLFKIIDESHRLLNENKYLILNLKNKKDFNLVDDVIEHCKKQWDLIKIYKMKLINSEFQRNKKNPFHYEPILVFKKISF